MSKSRLARRYFPEATDVAARARLMRWINACPPLCEALSQAGYHPRQRIFTARQVRLIASFLDAPD